MHLQLLFDVLGFVALGMFAGTLSGLMGAGGGLVTVPGLVFILNLQGIAPALVMHVAVGTTLGKMVFVASRSLRAHLKRHIPFFTIYRQMLPGVIVGVIAGGVLAHFMHSSILKVIFGLFVLLMAMRMLFPKKTTVIKALPGQFGMLSAGGFLGLQSGLLGIGGSAFTIPFLTHRGVSIRIAVVVSVAFAATVALLGAIIFIITGLHATGLPKWSLGYIYLPAWLGVTVGGVLMAPIGAKLSHHLKPEILKRYFGVFLIIMGVHMLLPL